MWVTVFHKGFVNFLVLLCAPGKFFPCAEEARMEFCGKEFFLGEWFRATMRENFYALIFSSIYFFFL